MTDYTRIQVPGLPGVFFRDQELALGGRTLRIYSASAVDVLGRKGNGPIPYWPVAWPAGLALARYLADQDLAGERVLEVGCGVGVSGLGAALGGARVLATDSEPPALRLAMMNARRNGLTLRAAAADWRAWPLWGAFDRVVGSDVTYETAAFDALLAVLDGMLRPGGGGAADRPGPADDRGLPAARSRRRLETRRSRSSPRPCTCSTPGSAGRRRRRSGG